MELLYVSDTQSAYEKLASCPRGCIASGWADGVPAILLTFPAGDSVVFKMRGGFLFPLDHTACHGNQSSQSSLQPLWIQ